MILFTYIYASRCFLYAFLYLVRLCVLLTSCFPKETWSISPISVINFEETYNDRQHNVCEGGLQGVFTFPGREVTVADITAVPGQEIEMLVPNFDDDRDVLISSGMAVAAEAWCYDQVGNEMGYAKVQGTLKYDYNRFLYYQIDVYSPVEHDGQNVCFEEAYHASKIVETHGNPPCIFTSENLVGNL
ncbi:MAG: hypothetical protein AAF708_09870 [Deinococcota bacterium]